MANNPFNATLKKPKVAHSWQNLAHHRLSSMFLGTIHPNLSLELLPADIVTGNSLCKIRLAPMKFPCMSHIQFNQHYFQIPIRLLLGDKLYELFMNTEGEPYKLPRIAWAVGEVLEDQTEEDELDSIHTLRESIFDYLGYDVNPGSPYYVTSGGTTQYYGITLGNGLKFLSYLLVYRTYFADEVLQLATISQIDDTLERYRNYVTTEWVTNENHSPAPFVMVQEDYSQFFRITSFQSNLIKDYFNSASVEPQRGDPVFLPLTPEGPTWLTSSGDPADPWSLGHSISVKDGETVDFYNKDSVYELSRPSLSISELWKLEQIQRFKNVDNFFGSRVVEKLFGHFGVVCSDARFQIPRYLGGASQLFDIQEVLQTSESSEESALGSFAGKGSMYRLTRGFRNLFIEEHSILLGICTTTPENGYSNGLDRFDLKDNCLDFAWPEFNNIGYQEVWKGELFSAGGDMDDPDSMTEKDTFGYQPRYSDYRAQRNLQTGQFRYDPIVESWSQYHIYDSQPGLSEGFIKSDPNDIARVFNVVEGAPQAFFDSFHNIGVFRIVSRNGINSMHL